MARDTPWNQEGVEERPEGWQASFKSHPSVPGAALLRPWTPGQGRAEGPSFLPLQHWGTFLSTQGPWGFWQKRGIEPRRYLDTCHHFDLISGTNLQPCRQVSRDISSWRPCD